MSISVIIPTLDEERVIVKTLDAICRLVNVSEIIVLDGGSSDDTVDLVRNYEGRKAVEIIQHTKAGRGVQMNVGAEAATGEVLWFLHADTRPVQGCGRQILELMRYPDVVGGNFELIFDGEGRWPRFLTWLYPQLRSMGLVYGDSGIFVRRSVFEEMGGYREFELFEDVDLYKRLQKRGSFAHVSLSITTSSRRFEDRSFLLTFAKWSIFQGLFWLGIPPKLLAARYKALR